jgi:XisI protein
MDKLTHYKSIVKDIVTDILHLQDEGSNNMVVQPITDDVNGQYLLYNNTWQKERRQYGCFLHLEVNKSGKIWIHHDGTDLIIAQKLLDSGVPHEDIVLGFRAPIVRPDTGFAVA